MKISLILLLVVFHVMDSAIDGPTRCRPGDVGVDKCGNLCRCMGDGMLRVCSKIFCPAFDQIPRAATLREVWGQDFPMGKHGRLFNWKSAENILSPQLRAPRRRSS